MGEKKNTILKALIPIADGIAQMLGPGCEVAIHDLTKPRNSVYYIVNGEVTKRKIGDALGPMFDDLSKLANVESDTLINYYLYQNCHSLKCSKILIRDEDDALIGCFCINIVLDDYLKTKQLIDRMCETKPLEGFALMSDRNGKKEDEISDFVSHIISNTYQELVQTKGVLTPQDKIDMARFLDEKGVFKVKGTIDVVADLLGVSKYSVYNYLDKSKSE